MKNRKPLIGIGISCHNRPAMTRVCIDHYRRFTHGAEIIVVDDGSKPPFPQSDARHKKSLGIAATKNKCLSMLEHCDYIILSDDDNYPIKEGWEKAYIEAYEKTGCEFFSLTWSREDSGKHGGHAVIKKHEHITEYAHACGVMIFMTNKCLNTIGGMDTNFGKYGHEHIEYQRRAYNAGMSPFVFCDIPNSLEFFYPHDFYKNVKSTVENKKGHCRANYDYLQSKKDSKEFIPYKAHDNAVITNYLAGKEDPQSGRKYSPVSEDISCLVHSCHNQLLVVLTDCIESRSTNILRYVDSKSEHNPYFQRWLNIREYLSSTRHEKIFCVDATDVEVLNNPFHYMEKDTLYVGDEQQVVGCKWMLSNHRASFMDEMIKRYGSYPLLNAGVIGGYREIMILFLDKFIDLYHKTKDEHQLTDMALFNYVLYEHFNYNIVHGRKVTTKFKKYEKNSLAWFRHK